MSPMGNTRISKTVTHPRWCTTLKKLRTSDFLQLSGSNRWKKPLFKSTITCTRSIEITKCTNVTRHRTLILISDHFQNLLVAQDLYFVCSEYGHDPHWDKKFHDQNKLQYKHNHKKPHYQIQSNLLFTSSHASDTR